MVIQQLKDKFITVYKLKGASGLLGYEGSMG
jgi:hypothetical protein